MQNYPQILNKALEKIKPNEKEISELNKTINSVLTRINKNLKDAKAILGGSGAKNTYLKNTTDIDIYVKFNYQKFKDRSDQLSKLLERTLKKTFKNLELLHGSRDYFQIKQNNLTFEIVPILDIKKPEQAKNITDLSQLHVNYVKKYHKIVNEIRLIKQFCKANNCYGAESYIQGLSGYALELLIIDYKSFLNLLKVASKWKEKTYIGNKKDIENLNFSKKISPLILIDPTQKQRNASAALSKEKYNLFINTCKNFLKRPSENFFIEKEFKPIKKPNSIIIEITPEKGKKDVVGAKLLKCFEYIKTQFKYHKIKKAEWHFNKKAIFYFILKKQDYIIRYGPPLIQKENIQRFKSKHKQTFIKNSRIAAKIKAQNPKNLINSLLKNKEFRKIYKVKNFHII